MFRGNYDDDGAQHAVGGVDDVGALPLEEKHMYSSTPARSTTTPSQSPSWAAEETAPLLHGLAST